MSQRHLQEQGDLPQRLSTHELFRQGNARVHVNRPIHQGQIPLHDHDFFECAVVLAGRARHRSMHAHQPAAPGLAVWLPPGHWHAWEGCRDLEIVNLCLSVDLLDGELSWCVGDRQLGTLWADSSVRCWHLPGSVTAQIDRLGGELIAHQDRNYAAALGLVLQWLGTIAAHLPPAEQGVQPDAMVRQLRVAMRQRLAYDWSLAELAAVVGLEPSYCGRRFRRAVGQSPLQWLARQRCEQAAIALLTTADPVAAIGIGVGWSDPNYFSRIFKKYFSLSPTAYRQQFAQPGLQVRCRDDHWLQW